MPPEQLGLEVVVTLLLVGIAAIFAIVKVVDRWHLRDDEGVTLQVKLGEALMRDARLATLPLTVTVHVPYWRGRPTTVEIHGTVPSPQLREAALRVVSQELARLDPSGRVDDRLTVQPPPMIQRSA